MTKAFKYNQKEYKFYVANLKLKKVHSGWEYREDAQDEIPYLFLEDRENYKVYTRSYLSRFVDLDDNKVWEEKFHKDF